MSHETYLENVKKGRVKQEAYAKMRRALTAPQVLEIRRLYDEGWSQGRLAREFRVSACHIGQVVRREIWKEV